MPLHLLQGDIAACRADALVTAANKELRGGGGVDAAIHRAAGPKLLRAIRDIGGTPTGSAVITPAFELEARGVRFIIHAVGPVWRGGAHGEEQLLASAYRSALELAAAHGCQSVVFPAISSGVYGYPLPQAARVALRSIQTFLRRAPALDASVVLYDARALHTFEEALRELT